ncbi:alkaline phosphatase family protein [Flavobacterium lutivivi]|nr:alkaline phosphatase family protein [Flavobacterium lutivivi]
MRFRFSLLAFLFAVNIYAQQRPKLVVGIVVDQMKMEYLYRFQNDFSANGFKRLMNEGFTYHNANFNYVPTYTAPGHASIYTGTTPSVNGIVGNEWFSRMLGKVMYCTDDAAVKILGLGSEIEGKMSPKNLLTTTITDELKLSTNFKGKVIGMSLKDRGAILPAGHFADWAFWLSNTGNFISSTFYGENLPDWVASFNAEKRCESYLKSWDLYKPIETYNESLADDNPYEGKLYGVEKPIFPYNLKAMFDKSGASVIRATPFGNNILEDFAKKAVTAEKLGQDNETDFLTISFSSTDYIGHIIGPRSIELQDTYLRLDETIADFLSFLDKSVGKGNYLVFLTADHACAENARFLSDHKYNVTNVETASIQEKLKQFSTEKYGENLVLNYSNFNLFLNKQIIASKNLQLNNVKKDFIDFLMSQPQVKRVYTEEEILANSGADYFLNFIFNGYDVTQNGDLVVLDKPGYIEYGPTGSSHGTAYMYDTNVPLLFYGWKIKHGESHKKKLITQIAPTLAQKLSLTMPNGTEGEVLQEILK